MNTTEAAFQIAYKSVHQYLVIAYICLAMLVGSAAVVAAPPNLVFILSDDQGIDAIQGANWPNDLQCRTPNLAALATEGRTFSNCRANPFCSPTRAGLMTGRSALHTGVIGNVRRKEGSDPDRDLVSVQGYERTIAEVLHDQGYYTIHVDKWQLGYSTEREQRPEQQGFDVTFNRFDYYDLDDPDLVGDKHLTLRRLRRSACCRHRGVPPAYAGDAQIHLRHLLAHARK